MEEFKMTAMQTLLGQILKNRINAELKKEVKDFTPIQEAIDIFLAGDKITSDEYAEFTKMTNPTTTTTDTTTNKTIETTAS
jgi:5,10-methylene-tetrahydrofolate dehydrogenase/methenyl tetrahydrofolate cyclohydrolase